MRAMLAIEYYAGLRCGEACALEADAINWQERSVRVPAVDGLCKTGGRRVGLPQSKALDEALKAWEAVRDGSCPHFFHTNEGKMVDPSQIRRRLAQIAEKSGIDVHAHSLRHSFARNALAAGLPINALQSALGHKDLRTTMRYTRLTEKQQIDALRNLTL